MSLAERRHHEQRIKRKFYRKNRAKRTWSHDAASAGKYAHHGKPDCHCALCRWDRAQGRKLTIQEKKANASDNEME